MHTKRKSLTSRPNSERNNRLYDTWSLMHLAMGILFGWIMPPLLAIALLILYEPIEVFVLSPLFARLGIDFGFEALRNSLSDIAFDVIGVAIGFYLLTEVAAAPLHLF